MKASQLLTRPPSATTTELLTPVSPTTNCDREPPVSQTELAPTTVTRLLSPETTAVLHDTRAPLLIVSRLNAPSRPTNSREFTYHQVPGSITRRVFPPPLPSAPRPL